MKVHIISEKLIVASLKFSLDSHANIDHLYSQCSWFCGVEFLYNSLKKKQAGGWEDSTYYYLSNIIPQFLNLLMALYIYLQRCLRFLYLFNIYTWNQ